MLLGAVQRLAKRDAETLGALFQRDCDRPGAEPLGELHQIRIAKLVVLHPRVGGRKQSRHSLTDHAQIIVVKHHPDGANPVLRGGRDLGTMHHERAVADDRNAMVVGSAKLAADDGADAKSHRPHVQRAVVFQGRIDHHVVERPAHAIAGVDEHVP